MSFGCELVDPVTKETMTVPFMHGIHGPNIPLGGTNELRISVTYNYANIYYKVMGGNGLRNIEGKTGAETIPIFQDAISKLKDDVNPDYWEPTEGNAKRALYSLLALAQMGPDGIWTID